MKEIVIKSDGHTAKLFVDGREVNKATAIEFVADAASGYCYCAFEKYRLNINGNVVVDKETSELITDRKVVFDINGIE